MSDLYQHIASTIKMLRLERGWSQEALAERIKEPPNNVSRWETATYRPSAEQLEVLARLFGISITTFFPSLEKEAAVPSALLSATRGLGKSELQAVIEYAEFTKARAILKSASARKKGREGDG